MADYAARVRAARAYADLTQQELADALGVNVQTIKRRELAPRHELAQPPKKGERRAIAGICGVPVEFMEAGFGGESRSELNELVAGLDEQLRLLRGETAARDAEVLKRLDEGLPPNRATQPPQQP
jgi:transcriptional regulator with XRE-family HTH domain